MQAWLLTAPPPHSKRQNCLPLTDLPAATTELAFGSGAYTGTIPTQIARLTALTTLALDSNTLTGRVPSQLGLLSSVTSSFLLNSNLLSSSVPTQVGMGGGEGRRGGGVW